MAPCTPLPCIWVSPVGRQCWSELAAAVWRERPPANTRGGQRDNKVIMCVCVVGWSTYTSRLCSGQLKAIVSKKWQKLYNTIDTDTYMHHYTKIQLRLFLINLTVCTYNNYSVCHNIPPHRYWPPSPSLLTPPPHRYWPLPPPLLLKYFAGEKHISRKVDLLVLIYFC